MTGISSGTSKVKSLAEFVEARKPRKWADGLPPEIVSQIAASNAPVAAIQAWLDSIGIEGTTKNKVTDLVRNLRS